MPLSLRLPGAMAGGTALDRFIDTNGPPASTDHTHHPRLRAHPATSSAERAGNNGFWQGNHFASSTGWTLAKCPKIHPAPLAERTEQTRPAGISCEDRNLIEAFILEVPSEIAFSKSHKISAVLFDQLIEQLAGLGCLDFLDIRDVFLGGQDVETHFPEERIPLGRMDAPGF
jgi:hypothetical protein